MKYFTPELFVELNSDDDEVVDHAEGKWLEAIRKYRLHLNRIARKLPTPLKRFAEEYCLHDAHVLPPSDRDEDLLPLLLRRPGQSRSGSTDAVIPVKTRESLLVLWYLDTGKKPVLEKPVDSTIFCPAHVIWLYDEISCLTSGQYAHEILFSNGVVAKLVFKDFLFVEHLDV